MPKYLYNLVWGAQLFIHNIIIRLFGGITRTTAISMVAVMMIISLWAHTTRAEAPEASLHIDNPIVTASANESLVDGMTVAERAAKIDAFYISKGDLPLAGHGLAFVQAADKYGIDWRLIAAIGFIESTGGKHACKRVDYSAFGWGSCKINFSSYEESIDVISQNLGGHNPKTASHYKNKDIKEILDAYNPPTIKPNYKKLVFKTMEQIAKIDSETILAMK